MKKSLGVMVLSLFALTWGPSASGSSVKKPNIVFVLLDDLDVSTSRPYYDKVLPFAMQLKKEGTDFENTFVTTPLCCPSRAAILSGKYGHNTNVLGNGGPKGGWEQFKDDEPFALPNLLKQVGYRTVMIGKYLNGHGVKTVDGKPTIPQVPVGWTDGSILASRNLKKYKGYNYYLMNFKEGQEPSLEWRGEDEKDYSTDVVKEKTIEFLNDARKDPNRPFFAYVNPTCPHFPLPPAKRHFAKADELWGYDTFPGNKPNMAKNLNRQDLDSYLADKPLFLRETYEKRADLFHSGGKFLEWMGARIPTDAPRRNIGAHQVDWHNRMGSLMACDEMIRDIVTTLKSNQQWDNTIFVFSSDNGYNLGAHGLNQKISPYEEGIRVPLFISAGKNLALPAGRTLPHWILNIDLAPTLYEMAGEKAPTTMDGQSFAGLLKNPRAGETSVSDWRNKFLVEYWGPGLANGYLTEFHALHYRLMPAYLMDVPSFNAVRFLNKDGQSMLFSQWERYPNKELAKRRMQKDRRLGQNRRERLAQELKAKDSELYNISEDPYQLRNLIVPELNLERDRQLVRPMQKELEDLMNCQGESCRG
jgi:N-acetylglucosamine-6-sulfatase